MSIPSASNDEGDELALLHGRVALLERAHEELQAQLRRAEAERRLAEEALLRAEVRLRTVVPHCPVDEERALLAEVTPRLFASLDADASLAALARVLVPRLADWCTIYLKEGPSIRRVAVVHADPAEGRRLDAVRTSPPHDHYASPPVLEVLRTGRPILATSVSRQEVKDNTCNGAEMEVVSQAGISSAMVIPLVLRDRVLGALTLVRGATGPRLGPQDQALAEAVARWAAVAVDNARLYREAQEAIQSREEIIQVASHELRGALNGLLLALQALLRQGSEPGSPLAAHGIMKSLQACHRHGWRLEHIIRELLDVARISSGQLNLQREECDLAAVVQEVVARFQEELARTGSRAMLHAQPAPGMWDPLRLDQVVTNLLSNAIKYGGGRQIELSVEADADVARLGVRDHGIGIPPEDQARIFDRFARATSAHEHDSLGLGLYIARKIVDALGGTIRVASTPGAGSIFTVELPRGRPVE